MTLEGEAKTGLILKTELATSFFPVSYFPCYHHFLKTESQLSFTSPLLLRSRQVMTPLLALYSPHFYLWLVL